MVIKCTRWIWTESSSLLAHKRQIFLHQKGSAVPHSFFIEVFLFFIFSVPAASGYFLGQDNRLRGFEVFCLNNILKVQYKKAGNSNDMKHETKIKASGKTIRPETWNSKNIYKLQKDLKHETVKYLQTAARPETWNMLTRLLEGCIPVSYTHLTLPTILRV